MALTFSFPPRMENNSACFAQLGALYEQSKYLFLDDLILDFSKTGWFEANLCAPLGAILHHVSSNVNTISFSGMSAGIQNILRKNEFLTYYGQSSASDNYSTVIKYAPFSSRDHILFHDHVKEQLFSKESLPKMSVGLVKEITRSINEVFGNAATHGRADRIFVCGQYFPKKQRIDFTIANLGTTFHKNVSEFLGSNISHEDAIDWATKKDNSTRVGMIPGGLGLFTLLSLLQLNKGRLQISSGRGYWSYGENGIVKSGLLSELEGAIVNIEFNVNDQRAYILSTELDQQNIF